jgi:hypothetical protein
MPEGAEMPMLPVAVGRIIIGRFTIQGEDYVGRTRIQDAKAARPDIGVGCMLLCGVVFYAISVLASSLGTGFMVLLAIWLFLACAAHVARSRVLQQLQGAEPYGMINLMVALGAAYSGAFWALTCASFAMIGVFHRSVTVWFNAGTLGLCIVAPIASGLYTGHLLTRERGMQHPFGADAPLLLEQAAVARVVRRLHVARAVRAQVVRSLGFARSCAYTLGCFGIMSGLYLASGSAQACLVALCSWQLCVNCAGRVVMRRLHAHWYVHMFQFGE